MKLLDILRELNNRDEYIFARDNAQTWSLRRLIEECEIDSDYGYVPNYLSRDYVLDGERIFALDDDGSMQSVASYELVNYENAESIELICMIAQEESAGECETTRLHAFRRAWRAAYRLLEGSALVDLPSVANAAESVCNAIFFNGSISADFWREVDDENETCAADEAEYAEVRCDNISFSVVGRGKDTQYAEQLGSDLMADIATLCGLADAEMDYSRDGAVEWLEIKLKK